MSTTQINPNLIQVNRWRFVNAFLVREDDGFTLVDTTVGDGVDQLIAAARGAGADIRRIALTHGHGDHVGSLDARKQQLGDSVQVLMPQLDARIHAGEQVVDGKPPGQWPKLETQPDVLLTGGEMIGSLESAEKLRSLEPGMLVVGHGGPVRAPGPAMDAAIKGAGGA